ncbi:MAG: RNA 2',3'-cyclic phosphodiesterase [Synergistaceae bacterium]|jgi:2'-5' RNA ligase|nr:RNA 2',3'-cyclic phosphodiesterase [Synergistaceae bacterium]
MCHDGLLRTFVALVPPKDVLDRMAAFVARLRPLANYKWVSHAQLHLTLRFLGEAPQAQVNAVAKALGEVEHNAFDVRLDRAGGFPNLARPRALWLGGEDQGTKELAALAAKIEQTVCEAGFPSEKKRFTSHLTLGRSRDASPLPQPLTEALRSTPVFAWHVRNFCLVQSDLTPRGPLYTLLTEYSLEE